jgi:hypothetical protein
LKSRDHEINLMSSDVIAINGCSSMETMDSTKSIYVQEIVGVITGIKRGEDVELLQGRVTVATGRQTFGGKGQRNVTQARDSGSKFAKGA